MRFFRGKFLRRTAAVLSPLALPVGLTAAPGNAASAKAAAGEVPPGTGGVRPGALPDPALPKNGPDPAPPSVSCAPLRPGCDHVSVSPGRARGVIGLDAVDSATQSTNVLGTDVEPADQGLCAGNGYGYSNGGHWFFTEFASANTYANANYNPSEPGAPYLLNDFGKIAVTRDAFMYFYDEFPLVTPGIGGGSFNGAQELAFSKNAMQRGAPVVLPGGKPNPSFNVAIENMGTIPTPNGTCASDSTYRLPGITCWYSVIPAMPPDPRQFDNSHGGPGFMLGTLDFYGSGDSRIAVFDRTGLSALDSPRCGESQGELWGAVSTEVSQPFGPSSETHQGAAYWVIGTRSFDRHGYFTLTSQGYVAPSHEEVEFPMIAAPDHGPAVMFFTLSGNGGPTVAASTRIPPTGC